VQNATISGIHFSKSIEDQHNFVSVVTFQEIFPYCRISTKLSGVSCAPGANASFKEVEDVNSWSVPCVSTSSVGGVKTLSTQSITSTRVIVPLE
jgi:hypothetical protein